MVILSMVACTAAMPGFGDPVYRARVVDRPEGDAFEALAVAAGEAGATQAGAPCVVREA